MLVGKLENKMELYALKAYRCSWGFTFSWNVLVFTLLFSKPPSLWPLSYFSFRVFSISNLKDCLVRGVSLACLGYHMLDSSTFFPLQGLCILLAMLLKALGPHQYYESDDDSDPERVPLLKNAVHPTYVVGSPVYGSKSNAWNMRNWEINI